KYTQAYSSGGGAPFGANIGGLGGDSGFSDFFEMLFGRTAGAPGTRVRESGGSTYYSGGRVQTVPRTGENYEEDIEVTLQEALTGTQRILQMQVPESCPTCGGRGITGNRVCPACNGEGVQYRTKRLDVKIPA